MQETDLNVITHLLKVESEASSLIKDAQEEANKRISDARSEADAEYKKKFEKLVNSLDKDYQEKILQIETDNKNELDEFKQKIQSTERNTSSFNSFVQKVMVEL
ncbi:MAG: hypothetical protein IIT58_09775 [Treponema sp.]|nr:hypothetical protein [Treponema sp.]